MVWLLVDSGLATLSELETTWTYDDVLRASAYLLVKRDLSKRMQHDK
jgi:hypothetical protein